MTKPSGEGFPKALRVRHRREYLGLGRTARKRQAEHFTVLMQARKNGATRLGVTVSRKIGGAVVRNRVKRLVREVFRRDPQRLVPGHDLVVIAKPGAGPLGLEQVRRELAGALASQAGGVESRRA